MGMWVEGIPQLKPSKRVLRLEKGMVDKAIKNLVKVGLIIYHPTSYGHQYSLNPNRIKEIENIIQSYV